MHIQYLHYTMSLRKPKNLNSGFYSIGSTMATWEAFESVMTFCKAIQSVATRSIAMVFHRSLALSKIKSSLSPINLRI